jgi:SOS-response transcriptional repressor LexA
MDKLASGSEFKDRLDQAMVHAGVTGDALAGSVGISAAYVSGLRSGRKANPSPEVVKKLADALQVSYPWLMTGEGDQPAFTRWLKQLGAARDSAMEKSAILQEQQGHFEAAIESVRPAPVFIVPLVSWEVAMKAKSHAELTSDWMELIPTSCPDKHAFAMEIRTDSMAEYFMPGDQLILMPETAPWNECYVAAKVKGDGLVVRRFFRMGGDAVRLTAHNTRFPDRDYKPIDFDWMFPVYSMHRPLKPAT